MLLLISTSWSGCKTPVVVVPADQVETPVKSGELFIPAQDGVFMSDARYQRYRRAIADQIQRLQLQQK